MIIEDEAPPLVPYEPEEEIEEVIIEDEAPPLAEMPKTAISEMTSIWIFAFCTAFFAAAALSIVAIKSKKKD